MLLSIINKGLTRLGRRAECVTVVAFCLALLLISNGCRQLQLPAIDPNGRCLFLPLTNTTQLDIPPLHSSPGQQGFIPTPAYQAPVAPAPCVGANCEPGGVCNLFHRKHDCLQKIHDHFRCPGEIGELQLTPLRVVAPVGGEVVLLAGICGEDGYLVKREPIEWMIAPDSVGQIIEVNDDAPGKLSGLLHPHRPKVQKLGVDFAKGRTSSKTQVIDRGTPNCDDDIHLREGETWVSISSPTAGITRVTSLAPESKIWDRRRQTAVIYWLDAKWDLPASQIVKSDQRVILRTKVTKSEQLVPASGWLVQYTILNPAIATFVGPPDAQRMDERTIRTVVDRDGFGYAELAAVPGAMGTTPIQIDVISPAQPNDNLPELPVGSGQTFVTFSAAGLLIQANVPQVITKGDQFPISAILANPGDLPADNTQLRVDLPEGLQIVPGSIRPATQFTQQTDRSAFWDQGVLPANRQLDVSFTVAAVQSGDFRVRFQAAANGIQNVIEERPISISEPMVEVRFAPVDGVSQAEVGAIVKYKIELMNTGRSTLTNLKLFVKATRGLVEITGGSNEVEQVIPVLVPGEKRELEVPLRVQQEGPQEAKLIVQSGNAVIAAPPVAQIEGKPQRKRQPDIGVEIVFPTERQSKVLRPGESHRAQILVRNTGATTLTNLEVQISADERLLQFYKVDPSNEFFASGSGGNVRWTPPNMLPGDGADTIRVLLLEVRALAPTPVAAINVIARSAEGVQATATAQVEIRDDRMANPPLGGNPVMPNPNIDPGLGGGVMPPANNPPFNPAPNNPPPNNPPSTNPPANNPPSGRLRISINDFNDPEVVGKEIRYSVRIANDSNQISGRTQVELRVSEGAELLAVSSDGSNVTPRRGANGTIVLPTLEAFRVGEEIAYTIYMRSRIPQVMRIEATVRSDLFPNGETATETTTITPAN